MTTYRGSHEEMAVEQRLERARHQMRERDIAALLVGPSADLRYLVGYDALSSNG